MTASSLSNVSSNRWREKNERTWVGNDRLRLFIKGLDSRDHAAQFAPRGGDLSETPSDAAPTIRVNPNFSRRLCTFGCWTGSTLRFFCAVIPTIERRRHDQTCDDPHCPYAFGPHSEQRTYSISTGTGCLELIVMLFSPENFTSYDTSETETPSEHAATTFTFDPSLCIDLTVHF